MKPRTTADIIQEIRQAATVAELQAIQKRYLGKESGIARGLKDIRRLDNSARAKKGKALQTKKTRIADAIASRAAFLEKSAEGRRLERERIDVTHPGIHIMRGSIHPLQRIIQDSVEIFAGLGFSVVLGPEVETEWYNFDALNISEDHPARDLWDTFWLRQREGKRKNERNKTVKQSGRLLMRTHTSPVQIRYMETHQPPFRIIVPGKVFRYEATDAAHDIEFFQLEGLLVGSEVSVAHLKSTIELFFQQLFHTPLALRLRPSFFPFTEPSFEFDISCFRCAGQKSRVRKDCALCGGAGWLEIGGAGMVHPRVFHAAHLNPRHVRGFAFGMGLDRIAMMKYKIPDIRLFHSNNLKFLEQFR